MLHARLDYQDRIIDMAEKFPDLFADCANCIQQEEPVFLLRANDRCAPAAVLAWANFLETLGGDQVVVDHVRNWAKFMSDWRIDHDNGKVPDAPHDQLRLD